MRTDDRLAAATAIADEHDVTIRTATRTGQPDQEIIAYAEEERIDHVVMGSHGRTGLTRVVLGSVAETVVRRSPTPVTIIREGDPDAEAA